MLNSITDRTAALRNHHRSSEHACDCGATWVNGNLVVRHIVIR